MGTDRGTDTVLKFGVDRILSSEVGVNPVSDGRRTASRTCAECPLLRCCPPPVSFFQPPHYFTPITILHAPKPLRPYPTIVSEREERQGGGGSKRKRSWSRAVFSSLQRKGLEKRFQLQKYITKPDRRQLAATLGLTDAQVKVWFQNRRMKWRHTKEMGCGPPSGGGSSPGCPPTNPSQVLPPVTRPPLSHHTEQHSAT